MSTEIATRSGTAVATNDDYYAALAAEASNLKGGGDGKAFMKFSGNDGSYSYGADDVPLDNGTLLVMNARSYKRGWVIWVDSEVVYEVMKPLGEDAPTKASLPDHGPYSEEDGPVEQYTIEFGTMEEPFVEMIFQANNTSKRRALAALLKDFGAQYKLHPKAFPQVEISEKEFEGKTKGGRKVTKHAPIFKIVGWISEDDLNALAEGSPEDYEPETTGTEGAPAEQAEAEAVVETPKQTAPKVTTAPAKTATGTARPPRSRF